MNLVWLKKDLRLSDHAPLYFAIAAQEPFVVFFCFEPIVHQSATFNVRHWWFIWQSLQQLQATLLPYKIEIQLIYDDVLPFLARVHQKHGIQTIFSHQETGIAPTYNRDKAVQAFCNEHQILWREFIANGVARGLQNQAERSKYLKQYLNQPAYEPLLKDAQTISLDPSIGNGNKTLNKLLPKGVLQAVAPFTPHIKAGEQAAWQLLNDFVAQYDIDPTDQPAKREPIVQSSSHLSAYIAYGNISIRQIVQHLKKKQARNKNATALLKHLTMYCNCMQLFEMECQIETINLNFAYNGIRIKQQDNYLQAFKQGLTGFTLIDAAIRCLVQTGYINHKLRLSLASFVCHLLWLDWRKGAADFMAQMSLDFEAGLHYVWWQQIANAHTYLNKALPIENPILQAKIQDPQADFIKKWLPELQNLPPKLCHNPSNITSLEQQLYQFEVGKSYPTPIINDVAKALKFAANELERIKKSKTAQIEQQKIWQKHQ